MQRPTPPVRNDRAARRRLAPRVLRRDGGICHLCGKPGANSVDHLVPESQGGRTTSPNLKAAHLLCNQVRGNGSIEAARAKLQANQTEGGWEW